MEYIRTSMAREKDTGIRDGGRLRVEYWFCISPSHLPVMVSDQHIHPKPLVKINWGPVTYNKMHPFYMCAVQGVLAHTHTHTHTLLTTTTTIKISKSSITPPTSFVLLFSCKTSLYNLDRGPLSNTFRRYFLLVYGLLPPFFSKWSLLKSRSCKLWWSPIYQVFFFSFYGEGF